MKNLSRSIHFSYPVFKKGINLTVVRWHQDKFKPGDIVDLRNLDNFLIEEGAIQFIKVCKFSSIKDYSLSEHHDLLSRSYEGLLAYMKKHCMNFQEDEVVTLINFCVISNKAYI